MKTNEIVVWIESVVSMVGGHNTFAFNNYTGGVFPKGFKTANFSSLFKEGDEKNPAKYRPISLPNSLRKLSKNVSPSHDTLP